MTLHGPDPDLFRTKVYGARWYQDPLPADDIAEATDERWPSVTTIKKAWSKPFRKKLETGELVSLDAYWAAEFIVDHLDTVESLSDDRAAALTLVATSPARRLNAAAGRGTGVHTVMEDLMAGKGVGFVDPAVEPFVAGCKAFVEDWAPIPAASEFVVINRTIGFGGTGDAILALQRDGKAWVALVDYKSRGGEHGCYEEDVAQIGGYSLAEYMVVLGPDGRPMRMALPALDAGLVVSLTTEGYAAYPVDLGDAQAAFLDMRRSWEGHRAGQKAARQARGNPLVLASGGTTTVVRAEEPDTSREIDIALFGKDDKPIEGYKAGVWQDNPDRPPVFGLMYEGHGTVMSYGLDYFEPGKVLAEIEDSGKFYFDAGGNGRPIWCDRLELAQVFVALGLIEGTDTSTTGNPVARETLSQPPPATPSRENGDQPANGSDASVGATESEPAAGPTPDLLGDLERELVKQGLCKPRDEKPEPPTPAWRQGQDVVEDQGPQLLAARKEWLQGRVDAIKAAGHAATLARLWSEHDEVPTFPKGGPTTAAEMDVVSQICWDTEGAHGMSFPPSDDPAIAAFEAEAKAKGLV